jgi:hypothetical protein
MNELIKFMNWITQANISNYKSSYKLQWNYIFFPKLFLFNFLIN